jgi:LytS/YehU family sensor histidine kinase
MASLKKRIGKRKEQLWIEDPKERRKAVRALASLSLQGQSKTIQALKERLAVEDTDEIMESIAEVLHASGLEIEDRGGILHLMIFAL